MIKFSLIFWSAGFRICISVVCLDPVHLSILFVEDIILSTLSSQHFSRSFDYFPRFITVSHQVVRTTTFETCPFHIWSIFFVASWRLETIRKRRRDGCKRSGKRRIRAWLSCNSVGAPFIDDTCDESFVRERLLSIFLLSSWRCSFNHAVSREL